MSATLVIIIAIAVAVVFGALAFLTLARRTDVRGAGALSAETVRRDASRPERTRRRRRDTLGRRGRSSKPPRPATSVGVGLAPVTGDTGLAPWTPPDPRTHSVSAVASSSTVRRSR